MDAPRLNPELGFGIDGLAIEWWMERMAKMN